MITKTSIHKEEQYLTSKVGYFIVYLMVGLIPHIYKYVPFQVAESESVYFKDPIYADLYMLAKSYLLLFLTALLLITFVYQVIMKHIVLIKNKFTIGACMFAIVAILSSVMSKYQDLVYWGKKDRFEGMWIWLCYLVIFIVVQHYAYNKSFLKRTLKVFTLSAGLMATFGLMQVLGYDIYTEGVLKWLAFPSEIANNMTVYMSSNVTEAGAVGALFNSNYFGAYIGLSAIVSLYFAFDKEKNYIFYVLLFVLQYAALIASGSEAALLGFSAALFFFVIAYGSKMSEKKNIVIIVTVLAIAADRILAFNLLYGQSGNALWIYVLMIIGLIAGAVANYFLNVNENIENQISKYYLGLSFVSVIIVVIGVYTAIGITGDGGKVNDINSIGFNDNILIVVHDNKDSFAIEYLETGVNAYDEKLTNLVPKVLDNNLIAYSVGKRSYVVEVRNYENGILLSFKSPMSLNVFYDGTSIQYVNPLSGYAVIEAPNRVSYLFEHGSAFTNRGYIWSTYLPEVKKHFLFGKGLDTFLVGYPQNDYFGKTRFYEDGDKLLIDKPHSMYLGVFFGMGVVGFVILITFVVTLFSRFFKGISQGKETDLYMIALIGSIMVLVTGIFNDSVIPMMVLLSCFSGMGLMAGGEA